MRNNENRTSASPGAFKLPMDWLHYLLFASGVLLLFQDLIFENIRHLGRVSGIIQYFDDALPFLLFLLLVTSRMASQKTVVRTNLDNCLVAFLICALASSFLRKVPGIIFTSQLIIYLKGLICFYCFANLRFNTLILRKYMHFFLSVGGLFLFFGIVDLVFPAEFRGFTGNKTFVQYYKGVPSVQSFFIHPAFFGWYMSVCAAFCISHYLVIRRKRALFTGMLFLVGVFLSMRLKSIAGISFALFLGPLILPGPSRLKKTLFLLFLTAGGFFLFWPVFREMFYIKLIQYTTQQNPLDAARLALYLKAFRIAVDHFPLGAGMGRYGSWLSVVYYSPLYDTYGLSTVYGISREIPNFINDTFWPMVLGETGVAGLLAYAGLFFKALTTLYKKIRTTTFRYHRVFYLATFLIVTESLVESVAKPVYTRSPDTLFIFAAIGICYALSLVEQKTTLV